ncbi:MAG: hypothetical protein MUP11_01395 [Anaerolineales bacterium]|nr:hypothetical protein [Anaerolineales bacterium]
MKINTISNDRDQALDIVYDVPRKLDWVVRENPKLQAELNSISGTTEELSSSVVNKVLKRIKDL